MTAQAGWLIALVAILVPGFVEDSFAVVGAFPSRAVGSFVLPDEPYASDSELGRQAFVWGADYLWSPDRFRADGIKPKALDFNEQASVVAVVDRNDEILFVDSNTGSVLDRVDPQKSGARSIAWFGSDVLVTYPVDRSIIRISPTLEVTELEVAFVPLLVEVQDGRIVVTSAEAALFTGIELTKPLEKVELELGVTSLQPLEGGFVMSEAVRGRYLWFSTNDLAVSVIADRPGVAIATASDTFGIWDTRTIVHYAGSPPIATRRTDLSGVVDPDQPPLVFSDLGLIAVSGGAEPGLPSASAMDWFAPSTRSCPVAGRRRRVGP